MSKWCVIHSLVKHGSWLALGGSTNTAAWFPTWREAFDYAFARANDAQVPKGDI